MSRQEKTKGELVEETRIVSKEEMPAKFCFSSYLEEDGNIALAFETEDDSLFYEFNKLIKEGTEEENWLLVENVLDLFMYCAKEEEEGRNPIENLSNFTKAQEEKEKLYSDIYHRKIKNIITFKEG